MTNHTPTPWEVRRSLIVDARGIQIAEIILPPYVPGDAQSRQWAEELEADNAAFIVQACNAHEHLVRALEGMLTDAAPPPQASPQEPVAEVWPQHLRPAEQGEHWCRQVLLYSGDNPGDLLNGKNPRVKLYASPQPPSAASDDVRDKPITEADYSRILADRSAWRARAEKAEARVAELEQQNRAILYDYHNGTPCEQIAWAQEREELKSSLSWALAQRDVAEDKLSWEKALLDQTKAALADARDKALEEAARLCVQYSEACRDRFGNYGSSYNEGASDGALQLDCKIRALRTTSEK